MYFVKNSKGEFIKARYVVGDHERAYLKRETGVSDDELYQNIVEVNIEFDERITRGEIEEDWLDEEVFE